MGGVNKPLNELPRFDPAAPADNPFVKAAAPLFKQKMYEGEMIHFGDQSYVIPSLSVKQARALWPKIIELNKGITDETLPDKFAIAVEVIHAAMSRNYPELRVEDVEELIDMRNLRRVVLVITGQSGLINPGPQPGAGADRVAT